MLRAVAAGALLLGAATAVQGQVRATASVPASATVVRGIEDPRITLGVVLPVLPPNLATAAHALRLASGVDVRISVELESAADARPARGPAKSHPKPRPARRVITVAPTGT